MLKLRVYTPLKTMSILIKSYNSKEFKLNFDIQWSAFWSDDFLYVGIEQIYLGFLDNEFAGFLTTDINNLCVTIEVKFKYQYFGVARGLIEISKAYTPRENWNEDFWFHINKTIS